MGSKHWILGGDFNLITSLEEKTGGRCKLEEESETFRDTIEELRLVNIIAGEVCFTWNNNRSRDRHIAYRLDIIFVSESIMDLGSELHSAILPEAGSNHCPVEIMLRGLGSQFKKLFRFEQFWLRNPYFTKKIKT